MICSSSLIYELTVLFEIVIKALSFTFISLLLVGMVLSVSETTDLLIASSLFTLYNFTS